MSMQSHAESFVDHYSDRGRIDVIGRRRRTADAMMPNGYWETVFSSDAPHCQVAFCQIGGGNMPQVGEAIVDNTGIECTDQYMAVVELEQAPRLFRVNGVGESASFVEVRVHRVEVLEALSVKLNISQSEDLSI